MRCLLFLDEESAPTLFMDRTVQGGQPLLFQALSFGADDLLTEEPQRDRVQSRFQRMLICTPDIRSRCRALLQPATSGPIKKGDLIVFMGDAIHAGPAVGDGDGVRHSCFITLVPKEVAEVDNDQQITPLVLAQHLYGATSSYAFETHRYLGELYPEMQPPIETFVGGDYIKAWKIWRKKSKQRESFQ